MKKRVFTAAEGDPDALDDLLVARLACSQADARRWIECGSVYVDGSRCTQVSRVRAGARLQIFPSAAPSQGGTPGWTLVREDPRFLAIHKPVGMPVQATRSDRVHALDHQVIKRWPEARLIHRIDREASGLVLFGRGPACSAVQSELVEGRILREYIALVSGHLDAAGEIRCRIARHPTDARLRRAVSEQAQEGEPALTHYQTLVSGSNRSLVQLRLATGRTHQIRVHLSSMGHPIIGDLAYGGPEASRLFLHAHLLALFGLVCQSQVPPDFRAE
jgi:23S rRNA pseudouridine1911/1915/1917 synthase